MAITWSPTEILSGASMTGLSNGNLTAGGVTSGNSIFATVGKLSGKWYWEVSVGVNVASSQNQVGIASIQHSQSTPLTSSPYGCGWSTDGIIKINNVTVWTALQTGVTPVSSVIGLALDIPNKKLWLAKNNVWIMSGDPANGTNPVLSGSTFIGGSFIFPACCPYNTDSHTARFDAGSFSYTPPTGFIALTEPSDFTGVVGRAMNTTLRRDMVFGGGYRIAGTAQRLGVGCKKRIRLMDRKTGLLIQEKWSALDGAFSFDYLANRPESYIVMELDDLSYDPWYDPACADRVTPEAMP